MHGLLYLLERNRIIWLKKKSDVTCESPRTRNFTSDGWRFAECIRTMQAALILSTKTVHVASSVATNFYTGSK